MGPAVRRRCAWAVSDPLYARYHDREWGVPVRDDRRLFEMLILEGAQAGLSWLTILRKREGYRRAFAGFDPAKVARFDSRKIGGLLSDEGIVRNRLKVYSAVANAKIFLEIQAEWGGFHRFIWEFVEGRPVVNAWNSPADVPATSPRSDAMSKELERRGMKFVGSTICYAFMQATGMVNDHTTDCFRYRKLAG
jgi:DNA-3-methyladenine glycosylase I